MHLQNTQTVALTNLRKFLNEEDEEGDDVSFKTQSDSEDDLFFKEESLVLNPEIAVNLNFEMFEEKKENECSVSLLNPFAKEEKVLPPKTIMRKWKDIRKIKRFKLQTFNYFHYHILMRRQIEDDILTEH